MEEQVAEGRADPWQMWLSRAPWIVLGLGVAGAVGRILVSLWQVSYRGIGFPQPVGAFWLGVLAQVATDLALVLFLFFALRLMIAVAPALLQLRDAMVDDEAGDGDGNPPDTPERSLQPRRPIL